MYVVRGLCNKITAAWNVLRGRPTVYRLSVMDIFILSPDNDGLVIVECDVDLRTGKFTEVGSAKVS